MLSHYTKIAFFALSAISFQAFTAEQKQETLADHLFKNFKSKVNRNMIQQLKKLKESKKDFCTEYLKLKSGISAQVCKDSTGYFLETKFEQNSLTDEISHLNDCYQKKEYLGKKQLLDGVITQVYEGPIEQLIKENNEKCADVFSGYQNYKGIWAAIVTNKKDKNAYIRQNVDINDLIKF